MTLLLLLACGPNVAELPCRDGFTRAPDGHCYPPPPTFTTVDLEAALANLPPCEPLEEGVATDLESGCSYYFCPGDTFDEAVELLGDNYSCSKASGDAFCLWETIGIEGRWDDDDDDGLPDPNEGNQRVHITEGSLASTDDGLGMQVPISCFIDALGPPDTFTVADTVDGLMIEFMDWDDAGLLAYDLYDSNRYLGADGRVDELYLYGAP